jgi:hypothetical protein
MLWTGPVSLTLVDDSRVELHNDRVADNVAQEARRVLTLALRNGAVFCRRHGVVWCGAAWCERGFLFVAWCPSSALMLMTRQNGLQTRS